MEMANYNVGIYCRLSKEDSGRRDESLSISNQKDMLTKYVLEKGWNLTEVYIDDGYSGTNFKRPNFERMIQDIDDKRINLVITKDLSRLGRNYLVSGNYLEIFQNKGIRFIAVNDGVDNAREDDYFNPLFRNITNEYYARDISIKSRSAKRTLAEKGKFTNSRAPYGYLKSPADKHLLIIDEYASNVVKRVFEMFLHGDSGRGIADILNKEGILSPNAYYYQSLNKPNPRNNRKDKWGSGTIMSILKNPVYYGALAQCRKSVKSFKDKTIIANPVESWVLIENTHEAIISKEKWEEAQKLTIKNHVGVRRSSNGEIGLFSGILRCADCGTKMTFNRKYYKAGEKEYYRCGTYTNKGREACNSHTIKQEIILGAFREDIKSFTKIAKDDEVKLSEKLMEINQISIEKKIRLYEKQIHENKNRMDAI